MARGLAQRAVHAYRPWVAATSTGAPDLSVAATQHVPRVGERRIGTLDGLRAISIALVLFAHLRGTAGFLPQPARRLDFGQLGVTVFFVISGYLITSLLLDELDKSGTIRLRRFYLRRTLRIFPAFYVAIIGLTLAHAAGLVPMRPGDLPAAATYTMNFRPSPAWTFGHTWSLAVEEQFYILWPLALRSLGRRRGIVLAVAVLVLAPVIRTLLHRLVPAFEPLIDQSFPTVADSIAGGCLLALGRGALDRSAAYLRFVRSPAFWLAPTVALLASAMEPHPAVYNLAGKSVEIAAITITLDGCMRNAAGSTRWLDWAPLSFVGTLSYSLYLWQQPFLNRTDPRPFTAFPLNLVLVVGFALASYYGVERPFLRLRQWLERRRPPRRSSWPWGKKLTSELRPLPPPA